MHAHYWPQCGRSPISTAIGGVVQQTRVWTGLLADYD